MAKIKLKYEIEQHNRNNDDPGIEHKQFCYKEIDILCDKVPGNPEKYKSEGFYYIYPRTNEMNVVIRATSTNNHYYWLLTIWVAKADGDPIWINITPNGIEHHVNDAGRADFNKDIKWQ